MATRARRFSTAARVLLDRQPAFNQTPTSLCIARTHVTLSLSYCNTNFSPNVKLSLYASSS